MSGCLCQSNSKEFWPEIIIMVVYPERVTAYLKHKRSVGNSTQGLGGHVRMLVPEQLTSPAQLQALQRQYFGAKECTVQHVG
jgi:hypothetical protein